MRTPKGTWVAQSVTHPTLAQVIISFQGFKPLVRVCADSLEPGGCFRLCSPSLSAPSLLLMLCLSKIKIKTLKNCLIKNEGCLGGSVSWVSNSGFQLRSWSHRSWVRALHQALHWQCGASLEFSLSLSLSLPNSHCLCLSQNKQINLKKIKLKMSVYWIKRTRCVCDFWASCKEWGSQKKKNCQFWDSHFTSKKK